MDNNQVAVVTKNSYEDVYGTGLQLRFGGGYMFKEDTELNATFTFQSLDADREFSVTLNKNGTVDEEAVISAREFSHPVFSHAALSAQRRWREISGVRRTHYCGAYWGYGFHEDGVVSALAVCDVLNNPTKVNSARSCDEMRRQHSVGAGK